MHARLAFFFTVAVFGEALAQCPVSSGTWTGQVGQTHIAFRITSTGTVVDSAAVSFVNACNRAQYSGTDKTPVVALQCSPWGFEWLHCRANPASTSGFRMVIDFDAFDHGTAYIEFLALGCSNSQCTLGNLIEVTPLAPEPPPDPAITCSYLGAGTIQYGVVDGGSGVHFDVETGGFGPIALGFARDLTGPVDTATFPVSCTGAGRTAVTLSAYSGATFIDALDVCLECSGAGQIPVEVSCSTGGPLQSTQWQQTYTGIDWGGSHAVRETPDGGFGVAGTAQEAAALRLIRTKSDGAILWERTYDRAGYSLLFRDMEPTADGGFVIAARIRASGGVSDAFLLKVDAAGDTTWTRSYGDPSVPEEPRGLALTSDGGYVLCGYASFGSPQDDDLFYVKTDASGVAQWTRTYGGEGLETADDVQQTQDGGYIFGGLAQGLFGSQDAYVVKTDAAGAVVWDKTYGGPFNDWAESIQETSDVGFVFAGTLAAQTPDGVWDFSLVRLKSDGTELWARTYGGPDLQQASAVRETPNGGFLIVGNTRHYNPPNPSVLAALVVCTSAAGNVIWTETLTENIPGFTDDVVITSDGGAAVLIPIQPGPDVRAVTLMKHGPATPTAVTEESPRAPQRSLSAFPNPFNPSTTIVFRGASLERPQLKIHDVSGRLVRVLSPGTPIPGGRMWTFDARGVPSGIYTAALDADGGKISRKLVVVK